MIAAALSVHVVAGGVSAQAPARPGPMQSGIHAPNPEPQAAKGAAESLDVNQLFATTCGWCHLKGGREAGKGPKLMGSPLSDGELIARIKRGKTGEMPAFASAFTDQQLRAIVTYIRELKP
jgi:mono/diheme cytochrome c family protein